MCQNGGGGGPGSRGKGEEEENIRGRGELDFSIYTARPEERGVENVESIGGHDDLDVLRGFEAV